MKNKLNWLEAALLLAPFLVLGALWKDLPPRLPIHWNAHGEIDRWTSNRIELLILPAIMAATVLLLHVLPSFDPRLRRTMQDNDRMHAALQVLRLSLVAFSTAIFAVQITTALGYPIRSGQLIIGCTLVFLAILGNYSGNLRPNYFVGIRTPWTLESAATWRATHRLGGRLMFFGAILLLVLQFFISPNSFAFLFTGAVLLLVVWAFAYSWHHFRTHEAAREA